MRPTLRHRRRTGVRHRPEPLHRLRGLRAGLRGVRHPPGPVADPPRARSTGPRRTQTAPMVCMHCEDPTCAEVCPADAIKQTEDGIVQSALKPRCIGCSNCVLACPFGVPKYVAEFDQMMKCDMCNDRTSEGYKPMCASVCPSEALWYGTVEEFPADPHGLAGATTWLFGRQEVRTKVLHRRRRPRRRPDRRARPAPTGTWLDDPFGLESAGAAMSDDAPTANAPIWKRDFPYEAAGEDEVTRREFARYLVLGAGAMAAGNVGLAAWTQLRIDQHRRAPGASSPSTTSPSAAPTCSTTRPTPTRRSSCASARRGRRPSARSAPTSAASSTTRPTRTDGTAPATRATSTPAPATCSPARRPAAGPHRRRGPRRRRDLGARDGRNEGRRPRAAAPPPPCSSTSSSWSRSRSSSSPSPSRRSWPTTSTLAWATAARLGRAGRGVAPFSALPPAVTADGASPPARPSPIATLFPGYFALVMATGIVAVGRRAAGHRLARRQASTSSPPVAYVVLAVLLVLRLVRLPAASSPPTSPTTPRASRSSPPSPAPTCSAAPRPSSTAGGTWPGSCGGSASRCGRCSSTPR